MPSIATNTRVSRAELLDVVRERHHDALVTTRPDGRPQVSPVTGGVAPGVSRRLTVDSWGPVATGGFPARLASDDAGDDEA